VADLTTRVLNFFSGPGAGKSTTKAGVFFELKCAGVRAAQIEEYATERSFEQDWDTLSNQRKVTEEQDRRQRRLLHKVEWIVTDSPLVLGCLYSQGSFNNPEFHQEIWDRFNSYENVNIWVDRAKPYQLYGRHHSETEARDLDLQLRDMMREKIHFTTLGDPDAPKRVMAFLVDKYKIERV
jgi:hypothetical protein